MPTKTKPGQAIAKIANPDADAHHMIRKLQTTDGLLPGVDTVYDVDAAVSNYLKGGYRLPLITVIGTEPGCVNVLYIFIKD